MKRTHQQTFYMSDNGEETKKHIQDTEKPIEIAIEPDIVALMSQIVQCAESVWRELRGGHLETIYQKALEIELVSQGLSFQAQRPFVVKYKGQPTNFVLPDLIVNNTVIVELKAVAGNAKEGTPQLSAYLRASRMKYGLLINFKKHMCDEKRFIGLEWHAMVGRV